MENKNEFMLIFRFEPSSSYQPTQSEIDEMSQDWGKFIGKIAIQEKLVSTYQLGFEGKKVSADKSIEEGIYIANAETLGGNMIVKANTIEEATELAKDCPILKMGGTVEVRNILPMN